MTCHGIFCLSTWNLAHGKWIYKRIFHDMAWNILKDFVLLVWPYSPTHPLTSFGTNMPPRMFLNFARVSQLGGANMLPMDVSYLFEGVGDWFPIKFPKSSHQIPFVPINIPSNSFCSHQYPIKILLFSPSSQTIIIKFLLFPSITHQIPFIPIKFPSKSFCSHGYGG